MTVHSPFSLEVMAGKAFGSGAHQSTQAALMALQHIARQRKFSRVLDMGCGSGILSLAAACLCEAQVLAVDINRESAQAVKQNAQANGVESNVEFVLSDGFRHPRIAQAGPYDLIICNMVAESIIRFARDIHGVRAVDGVLLFSGILHWLLPQVEAAYAAMGYFVSEIFPVDDWRAVIIEAGKA